MSPRAAKPQAVEPAPTRRLEMVLAFAFGCVVLAVVLWLAFKAESLSVQQFEILRIVLALAGGGVGAVIPGFLDVSVKAGTKLALRAGGALAVFIVLYFWSPAHWRPAQDGTVIQHTEGPGSPIQSGDGRMRPLQRSGKVMRRRVVCLLVMLGGTTPVVAEELNQSTAGWCSPNSERQQ